MKTERRRQILNQIPDRRLVVVLVAVGGGWVVVVVVGGARHCDRDSLRRGAILAETGRMAQIGIYGFLGGQMADRTKNPVYQQGIGAIQEAAMTRAPTSSYAWMPRGLFYGCDVARMLKGLFSRIDIREYGSGSSNIRSGR